MADAKIKLELESKYNGKAFKEAGRSIDDIGKNVNKAGAALSQIGGQFGALEGKAGKAAGAVGQFMGALTAGGPVAFVVAALGSIVSWIAKVRQEAEEANRKCREVAKEMGDSWKSIVAAGIVKARDAEIAFFSTAIEKGNAAIDRISKLGAAWNGVRDAARAANKAEADAAEAAIDVETARRVSNAASPEIGNMIQAEANAAKTYREGQRSVESAEKRIGDADTDIARLKGTVKQLQENLSVAQSAGKELARIEKQIQEKEERSASLVDVAQNTTSTGDAEALKAAQKQEIESLQQLYKEREALKKTAQQAGRIEDEILLQNIQMGKLEETRRKAVADKLKAEADAEARNIKAQDALQQAKDAVAKALQDRKAAEEKAAQAAREEARKGIQASMDAAQKRVAQIDAENARLDKEARAERTQRGMAADARHHNGLFGAYQYDTDKDGNIRRLRDYQRAQRYAERDMRENASAENERAKAEKRLERLEGMRHKSARTQKEIDQIKGFLGQGAKSPEEQIQENTKEAAKLLKEIKESQNALLKIK